MSVLKQQKSKDMRECSLVSETGEVRWKALMKKFSDANKVKCKSVTVDMPRVHRSAKQFPTGSEYEGSWDLLGMSGYGVYTFPRAAKAANEEDILAGVEYEGDFEDGMFHGEGALNYECGAILRGNWKNGELFDRKLIFGDGLEYKETDWKYCQMPDRRYTIEYDHSIMPAGESFLTAEHPSVVIPPGYYDTGDGFFCPETKAVYKYEDLTAIVRAPSIREQKWIIDNCRTAPERPLGPRGYLYEHWSEPQLEVDVPPLPACSTVLTSCVVDDYGDDEEDRPTDFWRPARASRVSEASKWKERMSLAKRRESAAVMATPEVKNSAHTPIGEASEEKKLNVFDEPRRFLLD